uniref:Uncharacterized protein n=1 Tax=Klebsiella pneumoniae TaxID=573 RepID=A0A2P1BNV0_KLEPN|nr:hypothetical protein [Klebsiella pneumoniae]
MAGKNLLRKALPSPDSKTVVLVSAPANGLKRVIRVPERSRHPPQRRNARARNGVARRVPAVLRRHGESGATGTVAASAAVDLDVRHQTLAVRAETALRVRRSYRVFSRLAEWLDDRTAQLAGSRRCPVWVCFKAFKKRHHSRKKKRKQEDRGSKQGKRGKEIRAARERGPVFRRRRRAAFSAVGQVIPCPFGYLRGLLYSAQKSRMALNRRRSASRFSKAFR